MTRRLQPTSADYQAVFVGDAAQKAEQAYAELWKDSGTVITADAANTELNLVSATSDEPKAWIGAASTEFPGGYRKGRADTRPAGAGAHRPPDRRAGGRGFMDTGAATSRRNGRVEAPQLLLD